MTAGGRNPNPYRGVDWRNVHRVTGCTHMHCVDREQFAEFVSDGLEFATFSNYYPSAPYYPLASICENTFKRGQKGFVRNGKYADDRIDFNVEIGKWADELDPEVRNQLPFPEGKQLFPKLPEGILEAPNAEHHSFADSGIYLHITAPGARLASGTFDIHRRFGLEKHGIRPGFPVPWRQAFEAIFASLMIPDGGGIVIAHPCWSHLPPEFLLELLDSDSRVLGIEVYNHNSEVDFTAFSESLWDYILGTGRQCFGFFVKDHPAPDKTWYGKIVLLPEVRTAEACLRVLRQGRFYGAITGNGLRFEYLDFDGGVLRAACNRPVAFQLVSKAGVVLDASGTEFRYTLPENEHETHVFLRLSAREGRGEEKLYAQPFLLTQSQRRKK